MRKCPVCSQPCLNPAWLWHALASWATELPKGIPFGECAQDFSSFTRVWQWQSLLFYFIYFFQYFCLSLVTDKPTALGDAIAQELADGLSTLRSTALP